MTRGSILVLLVVLVAAVAAAILVVDRPGDGASPGADVDARLEMTEFAFEPDEVTVQPGVRVLEVVNTGSIPHQLAVLGPDGAEYLADTGSLPAGGRMKLTVRLTPGIYEIGCYIVGHYAAGMVGRLIVEE